MFELRCAVQTTFEALQEFVSDDAYLSVIIQLVHCVTCYHLQVR